MNRNFVEWDNNSVISVSYTKLHAPGEMAWYLGVGGSETRMAGS